MTSNEQLIADAEAIAEGLKSPKTFNARSAANETTYPMDTVDVYSDAEAAHSINVLAIDASKLRYNAQLIWERVKANALNSLAEHQTAESEDPEVEAKAVADADPEFIAADKEAKVLEEELAEALPALRASMLTYHLRGLAPKQWRLIHSLGRKTIKEPLRKKFDKGDEGEEDYQTEIVERNIARINWVNHTCIASAIIKVTNPKGEEDTGVWTTGDVENLFDTYLESEYDKLKRTMESLTFANNLFQIAVQEDVDFLPKR